MTGGDLVTRHFNTLSAVYFERGVLDLNRDLQLLA